MYLNWGEPALGSWSPDETAGCDTHTTVTHIRGTNPAFVDVGSALS